MNTPPDILLDAEGYPTDEYLEFLRTYEPNKDFPITRFINEVLTEGWHYADWGLKIKRKYAGKIRVELHTGGWSGNEEIINVITYGSTTLFRVVFQHVAWKTGGHYYFEVNTNTELYG